MTVKLPIAPTAIANESASRGQDELLLRVGDLAQQTNKTVRALHLYEELGLLRPSERSKGGFRLYGHDALVRVRWISKLQEMGFSLPDIKEILGQWENAGSASGAMARMKALYQQKLEETRKQMQRLKELERELKHSIDYLDTCDVCDPERLIHSCTKCDLHQCGAPELVAGLHGNAQ